MRRYGMALGLALVAGAARAQTAPTRDDIVGKLNHFEAAAEVDIPGFARAESGRMLESLAAEGLTVEQINEAYKKAAAEGPLKGYLKYNEDAIVSSDIQLDPHSSVFDAGQTNVSGNLVKVSSWYDNEWGYSNKCLEMARVIAK